MTVLADRNSFDLFAAESIEDPYPLYTRLRNFAPVHTVPGTRFHLVSSWDLVVEAAERPEDFSSNLRGILLLSDDGQPERFTMDMDGEVEQVLATADGAAHKEHRKIVMQALARRIRALEDTMRELMAEFWQDSAVGGRIDWVNAVANRLPPSILARLLGIPDAELPMLLTSAYESVELLGGLVEKERLAYLLDSTFALITYLDGKVRSTTQAGDGLISVLGTSVAAEEIDAGTAVGILLQLIGAGAETTAGLIGTAARMLAEDPAQQQALRADPDLLDPFLDECLRLEPPLRGHYRTVARATTLGGEALREGDHLLLLWSAANRDETRYSDPDRVNLARTGIRQHLAFGKGVHFCVGSPLARLEATAAIRTLLDQTESFSVDPQVEPHWIQSIVVRRHAALSLTFEPVQRDATTVAPRGETR
ncbi:MAG: cytochrome P450 [Marmoricola sp.]